MLGQQIKRALGFVTQTLADKEPRQRQPRLGTGIGPGDGFVGRRALKRGIARQKPFRRRVRPVRIGDRRIEGGLVFQLRIVGLGVGVERRQGQAARPRNLNQVTVDGHGDVGRHMLDDHALGGRGQGRFQRRAGIGEVLDRGPRRHDGHAVTDGRITYPGDLGGAGQIDVQPR